jgi:hypothetical protein
MKILSRSGTTLISVLVPYNFSLPPCGLFHHYYWTTNNLIKEVPRINTRRIKVSAHNEDVFCIIWKSCQSVHSWANIIGILNEILYGPGFFVPTSTPVLRAAWRCNQCVLCLELQNRNAQYSSQYSAKLGMRGALSPFHIFTFMVLCTAVTDLPFVCTESGLN